MTIELHPSSKPSLTLLLALLCSISQVLAVNVPVVEIDNIKNLLYDENNKLSNHVLIYPAGKCAPLIESWLYTDQFHPQSVSGDAFDDFFGAFLTPDEVDAITLDEDTNEDTDEEDDDGIGSANDCPAVCVEMGVDANYVTTPLPSRIYHPHTKPKSSIAEWFNDECMHAEMGVINYHSPTPLKIMWIAAGSGAPQESHRVEYGERATLFVNSFLGHEFEFWDGDSNEVVGRHTVKHTGVIAIGTPSRYRSDDRDFHKEIKNTHNNEWSRHNRVKRTFSPLGFAKGRLPDDLWGSLGAYYYNNRKNAILEEWSGKGVFVNWWEHNVNFIQIPLRLKRVWQDQIKRLIEGWVGEELDTTDMYGMRQYEEGARLLTHVDREKTHAASLIINIAQGNLTQDWPVEVYDHDDRLHEVIMTPGDIVYYESARCLHGRNRPLQGSGAYYVNLFAHYRPKGDPDWLHKENPEGAPEPLVDVGECKRVNDEEGWETRFSEGVIQCEDERVGLNLSPTRHKARSGNDLYDWWRSVSPEGGMGYLTIEEEKALAEEKKAEIDQAKTQDEL
mmetsp:Transcript_36452/g.53441  ORF Transcript_36452/g.53441 Transcript_36452/m.53441 type:complete len:560 (-) Transcript_36452:131-1810(-)